MNRSSPPASTTVRAHPRAHHATSPPPRSPRRAATPLALEHTLQRCSPPPSRGASFGRPRLTHSRVYLVQDFRPHEDRDADAITAAPTPSKSSRHGRLALIPHSSCAAHGGCPRVNHSRVHLVHDRRPHEARDSDQPFRSRCLNSCHCSLCLPRTSFTRETA